jgi:hypothetical protein
MLNAHQIPLKTHGSGTVMQKKEFPGIEAGKKSIGSFISSPVIFLTMLKNNT